MDTERVRDMLHKMAENCKDLANSMSEKGVPLKKEEKQLIRFAACPLADEMTNELKSAFLTGDVKWLDHIVENLGKELKPFMD